MTFSLKKRILINLYSNATYKTITNLSNYSTSLDIMTVYNEIDHKERRS